MELGNFLRVAIGASAALRQLHIRGLVHKDVKPANILLTEPDGQPRRVFLADFGIARLVDDPTGLTATNMAVGTVAYAAPEQLRGESLNGRADQYALACTAFHLLAGVPPYDASNPAVVITCHVTAAPPSIGACRAELAGLDPVFAVAMAKSPADRFGNCQQFGQGSPAARSVVLDVRTIGGAPFHPAGRAASGGFDIDCADRAPLGFIGL